jgi:hypothetical protein
VIFRDNVVALSAVLCLVGIEVRVTAQVVPTIHTVVDTSRVTVGDRIRLTVSVEHRVHEEVRWPDSVDFGPFELLDMTRLDQETVNGGLRSGMQYTLTAFALGELELPSLDVRVIDAVGKDTVLSSEPWDITVVSVGQDDSHDIRDIKDPLAIPRNWLPLVLWLTAFATLGIIGFWLYRLYKKERSPYDGIVQEEPARPPYEIALERLDQLAASGMAERGEIKPYYVAVSDIMREYVEGRYGVAALEMSTHEVVEALRGIGVEVEIRIAVERFLSDCDLVKFAKWRPGLAACREMIGRARHLVAETRMAGIPRETGGEGTEPVAASLSLKPRREEVGKQG